MKSALSFWRCTVILGILLMVMGAAQTATAQIDIGYIVTHKYDFGTMGVARGQQARLNVFYHNIFPPGPCVPGERCFPPGPCAPGENCSFNVSLSFSDCDGNIVSRNDISLVPDRGGSILFTPSSFMPDGRACARATVTVQPDANGNLPDLVPTVEILDRTVFVNQSRIDSRFHSATRAARRFQFRSVQYREGSDGARQCRICRHARRLPAGTVSRDNTLLRRRWTANQREHHSAQSRPDRTVRLSDHELSERSAGAHTRFSPR
jgi:hypothetical protein